MTAYHHLQPSVPRSSGGADEYGFRFNHASMMMEGGNAGQAAGFYAHDEDLLPLAESAPATGGLNDDGYRAPAMAGAQMFELSAWPAPQPPVVYLSEPVNDTSANWVLLEESSSRKGPISQKRKRPGPESRGPLLGQAAARKIREVKFLQSIH